MTPDAGGKDGEMSQDQRNIRGFLVLIAMLLGVCTLLAASGCGGTSAAGGEWIYSERTDGDIHTVRTESGSIWGGTATLIEEASIGGIEGPQEYLLGDVRSLYAHDGRVLVCDVQVPAVHVYDLDGNYIQEIGREGGGPGEYANPMSLAVNPLDGTIYIRDGRQGRLNLCEPDGNPREMWPLNSGISTSRQMVVTTGGDVYTSVWANTSASFDEWRTGMARMGPEGATGDTVLVPDYGFQEWTLEAQSEDGNSIIINNVPFSPQVIWAMTPSGAMIGALSDAYRLEIKRRDGGTTVLEKVWDPVPVQPDEARWYRNLETASMREVNPGWAWRGRSIPAHKPVFDSFFADRSGRIWVRRYGPGERLKGCNEEAEVYVVRPFRTLWPSS